jgi:riboflavin synthase
MFTGIVQGQANVEHIEKRNHLYQFRFSFPGKSLDGIQKGASISINGTCLTVVDFSINANQESVSANFDVMMQSLNLTNLKELIVGDFVNFERAAKLGDEIGGHPLSGHIFNQCRVISIEKPENNFIIEFSIPDSCKPYLFDKGYVGLNGCSLTIANVNEDSFKVFLIPETLEVTTFGKIQIGDWTNIEIDSQTQTIVDTLYAMKHAGKLI